MIMLCFISNKKLIFLFVCVFLVFSVLSTNETVVFYVSLLPGKTGHMTCYIPIVMDPDFAE